MKAVTRWIGAVVGLLVVVLLVAIAVGTSLPIAHVATCSARFAQTPSVLYATVESDASSTSWRSDVAHVRLERTSSGKIRWIETYKNGQTLSYLEAPNRVEWTSAARWIERAIDDPTLPFGGAWSYRFDPSAGGSIVTIREAGWIYNPLFRLVEQYFTGYTATIRAYLTDLGKKYDESPSISCTVTTYAQGLPK